MSRFAVASVSRCTCGRGSAVCSVSPRVSANSASGVQVIPELAEIASQLTVFQRTPPWMLPKDDRPFDDDERHRYRNESAAVQQERERLRTEQHVNTALRADDPLQARATTSARRERCVPVTGSTDTPAQLVAHNLTFTQVVASRPELKEVLVQRF